MNNCLLWKNSVIVVAPRISISGRKIVPQINGVAQWKPSNMPHLNADGLTSKEWGEKNDYHRIFTSYVQDTATNILSSISALCANFSYRRKIGYVSIRHTTEYFHDNFAQSRHCHTAHTWVAICIYPRWYTIQFRFDTCIFLRWFIQASIGDTQPINPDAICII